MLFARRPFYNLSPEDECVRKQWTRRIAGVYTLVALGLFCLAFAAPPSDPRSASAQMPAGSQVTAQKLN
jgi:hypothetical protein